MKIKVLISILLTAVFLLTGGAFAAEPDQTAQSDQTNLPAQAPKPVEVPDIKIIIDGAITEFSKTPVSVRNSTLLPLRELLVKLGIPNDDEHIIYNGEEKSVTVWDGKTKIFLRIGQKEAFVNDKPITLNAAPILYQNSTYIPLRFVAEALDRMVVWEGSLRAAFICDADKYVKIKQLLDRSNDGFAKVNKYRQELDIVATIGSENGNMKVNVKSQAAVDKTKKVMSLNMLMNFAGIELSPKTYYSDNTSYTQELLTGGWKKQTYEPAEYSRLFESQSSANILMNTEVLSAGLNQVFVENDDEILLEGDVFLVDYFKKAIDGQNFGFNQDTKQEIKYSDFSLQISLDKNTTRINRIKMQVKMLQPSGDAKVKADTKADMDFEIRFSDYDGDFVISIPQEAVKNAVPVD